MNWRIKIYAVIRPILAWLTIRFMRDPAKQTRLCRWVAFLFLSPEVKREGRAKFYAFCEKHGY